MADTTNLGITKPTPGGDTGTWGTVLNTGADEFDTAVAGTLSKSVAGSADVSLTDAEALNANHIYTGELTGNIAVHVPIKSRQYQVFNNTTGSFTLKVKTSSETNGTLVGQGETLVLMCDGTSVISGVTGAMATSVSDFTVNILKVPVCVSATHLAAENVTITQAVTAATFDFTSGSISGSANIAQIVCSVASFTTKVSGVAGEFSGTVSAATFDGALTGNVTGDIDGATGSFSACVSATNFVAATGSFTTKVSGVAGEFSGTVSAATFDGALTGNVTGDIDGATGSFSACISATNLVAATGSFTTKVSGVAGLFSGTVSAATFDGALIGNVTGDVDGATGSYSACISATNIVGVTGSFTTKVSATALEISGATSLGATNVGGTLSLADNTLSRPNFLDYGEVTNAIGGTGGGTQDIDLTAGNSVSATVDTSTNTFTFSNPTASDEMCGFVLTLTNGGSQTVNWPASVDWAGGTAPTLTTSGVDILVFYTIDGGTIWHGMIASTDSK